MAEVTKPDTLSQDKFATSTMTQKEKDAASIEAGTSDPIELDDLDGRAKHSFTGSTQQHAFSVPIDAEYWKGVYDQAQYEGRHRFDPSIQWSSSEEKKLIRKIDFRIMLWVWIMFSSLDLIRRNINRAVSDNMLDELNMNTNDFNNGQTIYLFSFLAAELPGGLLSKKIGPDVLTPVCICIWGTICACQSLITNRTGFYLTRAFLGMAQGGFIPDMVLYLTYFYKSNELPIRLSVFWTAIPVTQIVGALMAAGLLKMRGLHNWSGWQWLFLIEGLLSIVVGLLTFLVMPASITETHKILRGRIAWLHGKTGWFTEREEKILVNRLLRDDPSKGNMHNRQHVSVKRITKAVMNTDLWPLYILGLIAFIPFQPAANYLSLTLRNLGYTVFEANMLAVPGYAIFFINILVVTWMSERFHERLLVSSLSVWWVLPFLIGLLAIPRSASPWVRYALLTGVNGEPYTHAILVSLISRNSNDVGTRAVSAAVYNMCYQFGSIIAVNVYRNDDKPYYYRGNRALIGITCASIVLFFLAKLYYVKRNQHKETRWMALSPIEQEQYLSTTTDTGSRRLDIKCSRTTPCSSCAAAGVQCEFRADDWKRAPISHEYVGALEGRVAALELLLSSIKTSAPSQRSALIDGIDFLDHLPSIPSKTQAGMGSGTSVCDGPEGFWGMDQDGGPVFHAPGSAYATGLLSFRKTNPILDPPPTLLDNIASIPKVVVQECVALFFKWQQPFCTLVERDALLERCRHHRRPPNHSPSFLLHAVCALGALMSDDPNIRELADRFAASAEEGISDKCFWYSSHIATAQTMLLCAVFATGKGQVSKAWMYSGMALRMTQDLGIHESNSPVLPEHAQSALLVNLELRRRMSLTFSISDKIFSLLYGRPPMNEDHSFALERPVLDSPNSSWEQMASCTDETVSVPLWAPQVDQLRNKSTDDPDQPDVPTLLLTKQAELGKIITDIQLQVHSKRKLRHLSEYWHQALYNKLNSRLWSWHDSLPGDMRWSRWSSNLEEVEPSLANLHMIYHTARISLNRSLLSGEVHGTSLELSRLVSDALEACNSSVEAIIGIFRRFGAQHTLKNAPLNFVHGAVAAVDATLVMVSRSPKHRNSPPHIQDTCLSVIDTALADMACAWEMANDARRGLREVLSSWSISFDTTSDHSKPSSPQATTTTSSSNFFHFRDSCVVQNVTPRGHHVQSSMPNVVGAPPLDLELLAQSDFDDDLATMFHNPEDSDSNFWNSVTGSGTPSSSSSTSSQASAYVYGT
ncbi:uncharacterized protein Z520_06937 [Fonsecaea multimorphosa CBS 102226]|uniref:Major facilitator superfamily (MFS) profile domain-containing protein n=1 Tax=Fonsecaea multimorphosa CBS 102226 TaxID=1442371 RepID=A0A0D2H6L4_9EURO|nr:uncharacterized protein Z520_06937 [Fonsecaea multimorphosa CBS 102226]KIX97485.1 hypothetical protein Z520_06937 [Fonsecaea multimorphosa CBS 102226]